MEDNLVLEADVQAYDSAMAPLITRAGIKWDADIPFAPEALGLTRELLRSEKDAAQHPALSIFSSYMRYFATSQGLNYRCIRQKDIIANYFSRSWGAQTISLPGVDLSDLTAKEICEEKIIPKAGSSSEQSAVPFDLSRITVTQGELIGGTARINMEFDGHDATVLATRLTGKPPNIIEKPSFTIGLLSVPKNASTDVSSAAIASRLHDSLSEPRYRGLLRDLDNPSLIFGRLILTYSMQVSREAAAKNRHYSSDA